MDSEQTSLSSSVEAGETMEETVSGRWYERVFGLYLAMIVGASLGALLLAVAVVEGDANGVWVAGDTVGEFQTRLSDTVFESFLGPKSAGAQDLTLRAC